VESLIKLGLMAITGAAGERARGAARRTALYLAGTIAVALLGVTGIGCALAALWLALLPQLGLIGAWLVLAAILLAAGAILALLLNRGHRKPEEPVDVGAAIRAALEDFRALTEHSGAGLKQVIEGHEWQIVLGALVAGILVGRRGR
jgi:hypothetical protein